MNLQLTGLQALVTGSTAGIGLAIAHALAGEGAAVIINGRSQGRVDQAIATLHKSIPGVTIRGVVADVGTKEGTSKCIESCPKVDILINNAGMYEPKAFEEINDADWHSIIEMNFMSGLRLSRHYLPKMKAAKWGRIIFISSESGVNIPVEMIHYGVTKTMQIALARGLAESAAGTGVTVNSVLAGPTRSEGVERFINDLARSKGTSAEQVEKDFFRTARPSSLLGRFASTEEVAAMVAFVASPVSSATTGAALRVEGGVVRSIV